MHWTERRQKYRAVLAGTRCLHPGSVFDPISARIAAEVGYEIGLFAGSTASLTVLGAPDIVVLTLSEFAEQAYRINRAGTLPLMVDADHGYGNALNVMRTVEELETAGVAALTIEDTALPAAYGDGGKTRLISREEGVGKMRAALVARQDASLVIIARTSAMNLTGTDDAVARIKAYEAAGVDAIFLAGIKTQAQIEAAAAAVKLPLILGNVASSLVDLEALARRGIRICLQGHAPFMAAVQAIHATMTALHSGTPPEKLTGLAPPELMKRLTRAADYQRSTTEFLGG